MIINHCSNCDLCLSNNFTPVKPHINTYHDIVIVSEYPSHADAKVGSMLQSNTTKFLKGLLIKHDLLKTCYTTYVVKCKPFNNNITPLQITRCRPHLLNELKLYKPKIIILFGKQAIQSIYPNMKINMFTVNGTLRKVGNTYIIMFHSVGFIKLKKERILELDSKLAAVAKMMNILQPLYKWI